MNILLITIDSLRADHLSCYGYHRPTSPNIDKLAKEGWMFTHAFSNGSVTRLSFPSLLTSDYPLSKGGYKVLSERRVTLPQALKGNGYTTCGIQTNPWLHRYAGYTRGFDSYHEFYTEREAAFASLPNFSARFLSYIFSSSLRRVLHKVCKSADEIGEIGIEWLKGHKGSPFFLWVHYMDVHYPYLPGRDVKWLWDEGYLKKIGLKMNPLRVLYNFIKEDPTITKALYDGAIGYTDEHIGRLLKEVDTLGLLDETVVVLTSDHGDEFMEHGGMRHHSGKLYNELLHVPLVIRFPDKGPSLLDEPVSLIDVPPTLLDYLGLEPVGAFKGRSLMSKLGKQHYVISEGLARRGRKSSDNVVERYPKEMMERLEGRKSRKGRRKDVIMGIIRGNLKFIYNIGRETKELYDLTSDPGEKENIADSRPHEVSEFVEIANHRVEEIIKELEEERAERPSPTPGQEEDMKLIERQLRKLGYTE